MPHRNNKFLSMSKDEYNTVLARVLNTYALQDGHVINSYTGRRISPHSPRMLEGVSFTGAQIRYVLEKRRLPDGNYITKKVRARKLNKEGRYNVTVSVEPKLYDRVHAVALESGCSKAEIIRIALDEYL